MKKKWYKSELANLNIDSISETEGMMLKHMLWVIKNPQVHLSINSEEKSHTLHVYIHNDFIVVGKTEPEDESIIWVPYLPLAIGAIHSFMEVHKNHLYFVGEGRTSLEYKDSGLEVEEEVIRWLSYENKHCLEGEE